MNFKKISLIAISASALLFTGCKDEKAEVAPTTPKPISPVVVKAPVKIVPEKVAVKGTFFELRISNGHLGKVILGLSENATDGYDKGLDDMAPPPGMQTGYTALVTPDLKAYYYRDTRKPAEEVEWIFSGKVYKDKAIKLSWNAKDIPVGYRFEIQQGDDEPLDMSKSLSVTISETSALLITAYKIKETK